MTEKEHNQKIIMKSAYIEAVNSSRIQKTDLIRLHNINKNILDKWLFVPDRYPTFRACYELHSLLTMSNIPSPESLMRVVTKHIAIAKEISERYIQLSSPEGGRIKRPEMSKRQTKHYIYNGTTVTVNVLSAITGRKIYGIYKLFNKNNTQDGDDVTDIVQRQRSLRTKSVVYNGVKHESIRDLAKSLNLPYDYVKSRIYRERKKDTCDVSHVDFSKKIIRRNRNGSD